MWGLLDLMGRPRIVRPKDGGEISLNGVTEETFALVQAALLAEKPVAAEAKADAPKQDAKPVDAATLTKSAVGTYKAPTGWHVVEVKYNSTTGEAKVHTDEVVGNEKIYAIERFKILAVEHDLV
jgi:hypothetical protein